jgi:hypothetical protein
MVGLQANKIILLPTNERHSGQVNIYNQTCNAITKYCDNANGESNGRMITARNDTPFSYLKQKRMHEFMNDVKILINHTGGGGGGGGWKGPVGTCGVC